uniref:Uncharacterized protein n=1 Tax=Anguilla anguilla TaxID=7936 RepID=A0A0E9TFP1_ANGAN
MPTHHNQAKTLAKQCFCIHHKISTQCPISMKCSVLSVHSNYSRMKCFLAFPDLMNFLTFKNSP